MPKPIHVAPHHDQTAKKIGETIGQAFMMAMSGGAGGAAGAAGAGGAAGAASTGGAKEIEMVDMSPPPLPEAPQEGVRANPPPETDLFPQASPFDDPPAPAAAAPPVDTAPAAAAPPDPAQGAVAPPSPAPEIWNPFPRMESPGMAPLSGGSPPPQEPYEDPLSGGSPPPQEPYEDPLAGGSPPPQEPYEDPLAAERERSTSPPPREKEKERVAERERSTSPPPREKEKERSPSKRHIETILNNDRGNRTPTSQDNPWQTWGAAGTTLSNKGTIKKKSGARSFTNSAFDLSSFINDARK